VSARKRYLHNLLAFRRELDRLQLVYNPGVVGVQSVLALVEPQRHPQESAVRTGACRGGGRHALWVGCMFIEVA